jgi:hypothetical protein
MTNLDATPSGTVEREGPLPQSIKRPFYGLLGSIAADQEDS